MSDRLKEDQIRRLSTEVITRILSTLKMPDHPRAPDHPLGGIVHIDGIGQVPIPRLRAELDRRHGKIKVTGVDG